MGMRTRERAKQQLEPGTAFSTGTLRLLALAGAIAMMGGANAQSTYIQPSVTTRLSYTDNVRASENNERSDVVAEIAPAIALARTTGRVTGSVRAQLRSVQHFNETARGRDRLSLQGRGKVEAIDDMLFVDMDASVSHQNRTDFFGRGVGDDLFDVTAGGTETKVYGIGPRLEFPLWGDARGTASYHRRWLESGSGIGRRTVDLWNAQASEPRAIGPFGWSVDYRRADTRYNDLANASVYQETARATLHAALTSWLRLRAIGGHESTNYETADGESGSITGAGFDLYPTDRTFVSGTVEDRIFGRTFHLSANHRRRWSSFDLSYSRDFSSNLETIFNAADHPIFQWLYGQDWFIERYPDPLQREAEARRVLGELDPTLSEASLTKAYFMQRRLRAAFSIYGTRNVLTVSALRSEREPLETFASASQAGRDEIPLDPRDEFARFGRVRNDSVTVSLDHRVSGNASVNARVTRSKITGFDSNRETAETRRTYVSVGMQKSFTPRTRGSLTYRFQRAEGASQFTENVVTASVDIRF